MGRAQPHVLRGMAQHHPNGNATRGRRRVEGRARQDAALQPQPGFVGRLVTQVENSTSAPPPVSPTRSPIAHGAAGRFRADRTTPRSSQREHLHHRREHGVAGNLNPPVASVAGPPLEGFAQIDNDFSVDRELLEPPALDLGPLRANEPHRRDIGIDVVLVGYEAADDSPVVGLGLW